MNTCKYCGCPLPPSRAHGGTVCTACEKKRTEVLRFIAECKRLKRILGIEEEPKK